MTINNWRKDLQNRTDKQKNHEFDPGSAQSEILESSHNNVLNQPNKAGSEERLDYRTDEKMLRYAQAKALGDHDLSFDMAFRGIDTRGYTSMVQTNRESEGLIFFTRPNCYLTNFNCSQDRHFVELLTSKSDSMLSAIRAYLDPLGQRMPDGYFSGESEPYITSSLVDENNCFISLLTNTCKSLSDWPDPVMDTYVSDPGRRQEVYGQADGIYEVYGQYDLTGSFKNLPFDPVRRLFDYWCRYQSQISMGGMYPRLSSVLNVRINYQTRIYRLVLDRSRRFVTRISATGAAHPLVTDIGKVFDFEAHKNEVDSDEVNMQFKCYGAIYNDPLLRLQFNQIVSAFNRDLATEKKRDANYVKLKPSEWAMFNGVAYPYIELDTLEFCWYARKHDYDMVQDYYGVGGTKTSETMSEEERVENLRTSMKNSIKKERGL